MSDKARMSMGVDGFGGITLEGTNEFVQRALAACADMIPMLLEKHIESEQAKGKSFDEAHAEFMEQFQIAVDNAKRCDDGNLEVSLKAGE